MSNEADTIADLARKAAGAVQVVTTASGREFLVLPAEHGWTEVTPAHKIEVLKPKTISQYVTLQNAEALVAYLERFKADESLLFANVESSTVVGVLDYHAAEVPSLAQHRATLSLPFSEEWKTWSAANGQLKPQLEFARFIEENAPDIKAPDAADLLEAVRDLQAKRSVNFVAAVRTESDNENFEYTDSTETRSKNGGLELPTKFLLQIPVYFSDAPVEVPAFLRWKLDDGKLHLGIKLHRAEHIRQAAFQLIVTAVTERTGVLSVFGKL
jgi:uncharacterized protein YfdQ (DUF2303 family)